jgi:hypothetical protein
MLNLTVEQIKAVLKSIDGMRDVANEIFCAGSFSEHLREEIARKLSPVFEEFQDFDWDAYIQVNLPEFPGFYCLTSWNMLSQKEKEKVGEQCPKWAFKQINRGEKENG